MSWNTLSRITEMSRIYVAGVEAAAARWMEVITHVNCPHATNDELGTEVGELHIHHKLKQLMSGGVKEVWEHCPTIAMAAWSTYSKDHLDNYVGMGHPEGVYADYLHHFMHFVAFGYSWSSCAKDCEKNEDGFVNWTCPTALQVFHEFSFSTNDGEPFPLLEGICRHLRWDIFQQEVGCGDWSIKWKFGDGLPQPISRVTAAFLEDIGYVVNPMALDPYKRRDVVEAPFIEDGTWSSLTASISTGTANFDE